MKKILAILMLAVMAVSLCACGGAPEVTTAPQNETEPTTPVTTAPQPTETEPEKTGVDYTIKVTDEGGNPVAGCRVQLCSDGGCIPGVTNDEGIALFENKAEADYEASVTKCPDGYEDSGEYHYFEGDSKEVTIVIKAIG